MAYGKKVYCTYYQFMTGIRVDVEIHERDFVGTPTLMKLAGVPATTRMGPSGDKYVGIKGREYIISIIKTRADDYTWLYTNDDRQYKVIIKHDTIVAWTGFVLVNQYQETFATIGSISITASDQIGLLGDTPYTFGAVTLVAPTGYDTFLNIILRVLTKTGLQLDLYSTSNLFEVSMDVGETADDPFDQASIDQDLWINDDLSSASCRQVLEEILGMFQCRILQSVGVWWVQRIPELANPNITYRAFHYEGSYSTTGLYHPQITTVIPSQKVKSAGSLRSLAGGTLEFDTAWKERILDVSFGLKPSLIPSFDLPDAAFTQSGNTIVPCIITGWTNNAYWWRRFVAGKGNILVSNTNGRYVGDVGYDLSGANSHYLLLPTFSVTTVDSFEFSIDCGRDKATVYAPRCRIEVLVFVGGDPTNPLNYRSYEQSPGVNKYTWTTGIGGELRDIDFAKVDSMADLITVKTTIPVPPENGTMIIRISATYRAALSTGDSLVYISNIKCVATVDPDTDKLAGKAFIDTLSTTANLNAADLAVRMTDGFPSNIVDGHEKGGDALLPFYRGVIKVGASGTTGWQNSWTAPHILRLVPLHIPPVDGIGMGTITSSCMTDSWWHQYRNANRIYRGSFIGTIKFHEIVKFTELDDALFMLDDVELDEKMNITNGTFIELKPEVLGHGLGTLTLKERGVVDVGAGTPGRAFIQLPGGDEGQMQFKSGGSFDGTHGVTFDPATGRILKGGTLPLIEYRAGSASVASGPQTVTFAEPFITGDEYIITPIWGLDSGGSKMDIIPYNKTINGFDVDCYEAVIFDYIAIIKR